MKLMDEGCTRSDGHYQLPLPFRNSEVDLPNKKGNCLKGNCSV